MTGCREILHQTYGRPFRGPELCSKTYGPFRDCTSSTTWIPAVQSLGILVSTKIIVLGDLKLMTQ
jgi:hypothetical protein